MSSPGSARTGGSRVEGQRAPIDVDRVRGVSFDVAGTLLHPAEPVAAVYVRMARAHGHHRLGGQELEEARVAGRFAGAFGSAPERQRGDGRTFWRHVVAVSLGTDDPRLFSALYAHYAKPAAWRWAPGARAAVMGIRQRGLPVGLLSNWDTRLRTLLVELGALSWFDHVCISGEMDCEKPDRRAFCEVADGLGLPVTALLHVGDSLRADCDGARAAGAQGWLVGDEMNQVGAVVDMFGVAGR